MKKPETTTAAKQKAWDALGQSLGARGVQVSAMFGMPALKLNGKAFGGLFGNSAVLKLRGEVHATALGLKGAELFDPSGMGRPMKEWVVVPFAHRAKWAELAGVALELCAGDAKKPAAKKKAKKKAST
ncbi:MAG: hypothetical protein U0228_05395 [Myxococcaceae bacterium]